MGGMGDEEVGDMGGYGGMGERWTGWSREKWAAEGDMKRKDIVVEAFSSQGFGGWCMCVSR